MLGSPIDLSSRHPDGSTG